MSTPDPWVVAEDPYFAVWGMAERADGTLEPDDIAINIGRAWKEAPEFRWFTGSGAAIRKAAVGVALFAALAVGPVVAVFPLAKGQPWTVVSVTGAATGLAAGAIVWAVQRGERRGNHGASFIRSRRSLHEREVIQPLLKAAIAASGHRVEKMTIISKHGTLREMALEIPVKVVYSVNGSGTQGAEIVVRTAGPGFKREHARVKGAIREALIERVATVNSTSDSAGAGIRPQP